MKEPADKTLVLITIDAEPSEKYENGCWSYCVNGRWPDRLDEWCKAGIARMTPHGYKLLPGHKARLQELQGNQTSHGPLLSQPEVASRISNAQAGLPLIFKSTSRYSIPAVVFLDVAQKYYYGEAFFQEACDLILHSGNDLQTHFHPSVLDDAWYQERGLTREKVDVQNWSYETLYELHRAATEDLTRFKGQPPIAYRAGAYRISDNLIDALVRLGYKFDFSYDLLNKMGNVNLSTDALNGNAPVAYRGLIEIPITAFAYKKPEKMKRFVGSSKPFGRIEALKEYRRQGLKVITYILHSYSLMQAYGNPASGEAKVGRKDPDPRAVELFEKELEYMSSCGEFEFVDCKGLYEKIQAEPTLLAGPAPFVTVGEKYG